MIKAQVFYDALGNPKEFVIDYLKDLIEKLKEYEGAKIIDYEIMEPINNGELWSAVAVITMEFEDLQRLFEFILDYPPSTIEVIEPEGPEEILKKIEEKIAKIL